MGMQYSRGLVAGYPFENTANDIMGVNNGNINGAVFVDGQCGRALSLDGVDDYVDLPKSATHNLYNNGSISIKFKKTGNPIIYQAIYQRFNAATLGVQIFISNADNKLKIYTDAVYTSNYVLNDTNWHHFVVILNGNSVTFYVDCVHHGTVNGVTFFNVATPAIHTFGKFLSANAYAKGIIESAHFFNKILTLNEIKRLYLNLGI